jgi:hypothetical protein
MRRFSAAVCTLAFVWMLASASAATGRIIKVLPQRLDLQGRHALSPSLFERDAYQAVLLRNPRQCSGLRYAVQWKAKGARGASLRLRAELLTSKNTPAHPLVIERAVQAKTGWSRWTSLPLEGDAFKQAGDVIAWRITLWDGATPLAEQRSFLW